MKKAVWLLVAMVLLLGLTGCGNKDLGGTCECVVELIGAPQELDMLDENEREQLYISVDIENIYTEKSMTVRLLPEDKFRTVVNLNPGTYKIGYCFVSPGYLLPMTVEAKQDKVEVTRENPAAIRVWVTNAGEVAEWMRNTDNSKGILKVGPFSHKIQFEGRMIDLKRIPEYGEFVHDEKIKPNKKETIACDKGVIITVLNTGNAPADWQDCELVSVTFNKNNVVWGKGVHIGMDVSEAVHAQEGPYGMPSGMDGTVLVGTNYDYTMASWLDKESGDKLTLTINPQGTYISSITYDFKVYE